MWSAELRPASAVHFAPNLSANFGNDDDGGMEERPKEEAGRTEGRRRSGGNHKLRRGKRGREDSAGVQIRHKSFSAFGGKMRTKCQRKRSGSASVRSIDTASFLKLTGQSAARRRKAEQMGGGSVGHTPHIRRYDDSLGSLLCPRKFLSFFVVPSCRQTNTHDARRRRATATTDNCLLRLFSASSSSSSASRNERTLAGFSLADDANERERRLHL